MDLIKIDTQSNLKELIELAIQTYVIGPDKKLYISYSGGKDSTVLLLLACEAIRRGLLDPGQVYLIFADTRLEVPALIDQIDTLLDFVIKEFGIKITKVQRPTERSFWARFLGEGTFAPNHFARWCVRDLKIHPIKRNLPEGNYVIAIGIRLDESVERGKRYKDKVQTTTCDTAGECFVPMEDEPRIFPLLEWKNCNIWDFLMFDDIAMQYPVKQLQELYFQRDTMRYGCWNCTVARDTELIKLHSWRDPRYKRLLHFRNLQEEYTTSEIHPEDWIYVWRIPGVRNSRLEQGVETWMASRLTIKTRKKLLNLLVRIQDDTGFDLISDDEINYIKELWERFPDGDVLDRKWRYYDEKLDNVIVNDPEKILKLKNRF